MSRCWMSIFACLLIIGCGAEPTSRATRSMNGTALRPYAPPKTGVIANGDAAVVIGIGRYTDLAPVPYADADARLFHQLLLDTVGVPTDRISNLHGQPASRESVEREVRRQAAQARDTLWIYFAGHGASTRQGDALLIGRDATADNLAARSIRRSELIQWSESSRAKRIVIVLDACFSGKDRAGNALTGERFAAAASVVAAPRVVVWSGTTGAQTAWPLETMGHGLFTWFAVGALAGWAADGQGQVTLGGASAWVDRAMATARSTLQRKQTPTAVGPDGWQRWPVATVKSAPTRPDLRAWSLGGASAPAVANPARATADPAQTRLGGTQNIAALAARAEAAEAAEQQAGQRRIQAEAQLAQARERRLKAAAVVVQQEAAREFEAIKGFVDDPRPAGHAVLTAFVEKYGASKVSAGGVEWTVPIPELAQVKAALGQGQVKGTRHRPKLVRIQRGKFLMGSPESEDARKDDERQRPVEVGGFEMMATEVTQAQFKATMGLNPSALKGDMNRPVEQVTWLNVALYANALSKNEGLLPCYSIKVVTVTWNRDCDGYRLPTEAEWEYAARAGTTGARYGELDEIAWWDDSVDSHTRPVAQKKPNPWGLYDMLGNAAEWCWDWYGAYPATFERDPQGPARGTERVVRGGSTASGSSDVRAAARFKAKGRHQWRMPGFRLVRRIQYQ